MIYAYLASIKACIVRAKATGWSSDLSRTAALRRVRPNELLMSSEPSRPPLMECLVLSWRRSSPSPALRLHRSQTARATAALKVRNLLSLQYRFPLLTDTVLPEREFVTCTTCDDYDLCISCHEQNKHGHHPGHGFKAATSETKLSGVAEALCNAGRNIRHSAVCDGCEKVCHSKNPGLISAYGSLVHLRSSPQVLGLP